MYNKKININWNGEIEITMKLLEWNLHKMTNNRLVKPFVCDRIIAQKADIVCLVEYIDDRNIKNKLKQEYWFEESIADSGNQILIAVSKKIALNGIQLIRPTEEKYCYNFLHVKFSDNCNRNISVIGIRMLSPIDASKQTPPLKEYLGKIKEPFLCMGDFNIKGFRISHWFPGYNMEIQKPYTRKIEKSSIIYVDKKTRTVTGYGDVDHILASNNLHITSEYKWDFIEDDAIYPEIDEIEIGRTWDIEPAYPDHAMMIAEVSF